MALLARAAFVALLLGGLLGGCYAPDLTECTVTCETNEECAGGQTCAGGLCTSSGSCSGDDPSATTDAGMGSGGRTIRIRLAVDGDGRLIIPGIGECSDDDDDDDCIFNVPAGTVMINAMTNRADKPFERWTSIKCAGQGAQCSDYFLIDHVVSARFK